MANRKKITAAIDEYLGQVKQLYPNASVRVLPDSLDGREPWIEVRLPSRQILGATRKFARLENEIDDRYGVSLVTITLPLNGKAAA